MFRNMAASVCACRLLPISTELTVDLGESKVSVQYGPSSDVSSAAAVPCIYTLPLLSLSFQPTLPLPGPQAAHTDGPTAHVSNFFNPLWHLQKVLLDGCNSSGAGSQDRTPTVGVLSLFLGCKILSFMGFHRLSTKVIFRISWIRVGTKQELTHA